MKLRRCVRRISDVATMRDESDLPAGHRGGSELTAAALPRAAGGGCQWELLHRQEASRHQLDRGPGKVCCLRSHHPCQGGQRGRKHCVTFTGTHCLPIEFQQKPAAKQTFTLKTWRVVEEARTDSAF